MFASTRSVFRWGAVLAAAAGLLLFLLGATGPSGGPEGSGAAGRGHGAAPTPGRPSSPSSPSSAAPVMPGMASGEGLVGELGGYRLDSPVATLPAGQAVSYPFTVLGPDGSPVTDFAVAQTRRLHFYAIRTDLTGYQHLHPAMAADGGWTADLAALTPGSWRLYAAFTPNTGRGKGREFVLSRTVSVPGETAAEPLPAAADGTTVDGYTVTLKAGSTGPMTQRLTVTVTRDGEPTTDLQPYLDSYAHLSAFHEGDQALAHLHPGNAVDGDHGGPTLTFDAMVGESGNWRVFLQFQTAGQLHTAVLTLRVP
ncbi:hypothetical protein [Kitasatospora sp. NPDC057015]|uniref:hypothetical protein n=1 Tax=Kitasatospora sp. NPDC057015 TaxID=3346001 RepID=UPI00363515EA